jgi:hypothetical protein
MRRVPTRALVVAVVASLALAWLPIALHDDVAGAATNGRLSGDRASFARGPGALAGTDLPLVLAALARMPRDASFSIVRGGRWGSARHPNRRTLFVWEAGQSWTQYVLAPRVEVAPAAASWLLIRDTTPRAAGVGHPQAIWRFGPDWLVRLR